MIRVVLAYGDWVAEAETDAPYSPDVLDDVARQARASLVTILQDDDVLAALEDIDGPDDPDDD